MHRRQFLKTAAAGTGLLILPSGARAGKNAPGNKLNVALIGVWGRGLAHYDSLAGRERGRALRRERKAVSRRPETVPQGQDLRRLAEVPRSRRTSTPWSCCTADHTHAFIANWALNRDLHVYCEKPLAISVEEARVVRANWLKKKDKLATQVGMQRHAMQNFNRVRELIRDGADRRTEGGLRVGQPPDPPRRLPARPGPAARRFPLRSLARPVAGASLQPRLFFRRGGHELPVVEHVLGLRRRPDRRHGQPHDGPGSGTPSTPRCRPRRKRRARSSIPTSRR